MGKKSIVIGLECKEAAESASQVEVGRGWPGSHWNCCI